MEVFELDEKEASIGDTCSSDMHVHEGRENSSIPHSEIPVVVDVVCGVEPVGRSPPGVDEVSAHDSPPGNSSGASFSSGNSSCLGQLGSTPHSTVTAHSKSSSPDSTPPPTPDALITEAMLSEEQPPGDSSCALDEKEKVTELSQMLEVQRFTRLQHLLEKSSIYSKFLLQRMESQLLKAEQSKEKRARDEDAGGSDHDKTQGKERELRAAKKASEGTGQPQVASESLSVASSQMGSCSSSGVARKTRGSGGGVSAKPKCKTAVAELNAYKLSDYMDNRGNLKIRKLDVGGKETGPASSDKGKRSSREQARFYNGEPISPRQPKLVTGGIMRSYQLDGMEWIKVLYENGVNGILADEMGLGKTLQCIGVIAHIIEMGVKGPFLVAAPLSTVPNWVAEFRKFTPKIPVVLYHGSIEERENLRRKIFGPIKRKQDSTIAYPVVVTSYEMCIRDQKQLQDRNWKFLVVDEGHRIKNLNCKLIRVLKSFNAANRLLLTGTPLQNNLAELWSLLNFLLPDIFDDLQSFQSWFDFDAMQADKKAEENIIAKEKEQSVLSTLHEILTPFVLRRLKTDVEFTLPPKKEVLVYAPLTSSQKYYYKNLLDRTILDAVKAQRKEKSLEEYSTDKENTPADENSTTEDVKIKDVPRVSRRCSTGNVSYMDVSDNDFERLLNGEVEMNELIPTKPGKKAEKTSHMKFSFLNIKLTNVYMMLRKCCNHPYLLEYPMTEDGQFRIDDEIITSCGKVRILDQMLPALMRDGHKTLIFSQFVTMLDILQDYMEMRGWKCARLDGTMSFPDREEQMATFRDDPSCFIFLLSTRAGGLGLNLISADTVIVYDSDWNPQADLQAQDRCHRIGQSKPVIVYRLVTANTIDQRIVERAAGKRKLEKMVIHKGKFKGYNGANTQFSLDDLMELLHTVDHHKVVNSDDGAIFSDEALAALLDRSFTSEALQPKQAQPDTTDLFKVLEDTTLPSEHLTEEVTA